MTSDSINKLRGLTTEARIRDEQLRAKFEELERQLKDTASGYNITGNSDNTLLDTYGDGDSYYGYLFFSDGLAVAYRTSQDDLEVAYSKEPWDRSGLFVLNPKWPSHHATISGQPTIRHCYYSVYASSSFPI